MGTDDPKTRKTLYLPDRIIEEVERVADENDISFNKVIIHTIDSHASQMDDEWYTKMRDSQLQEIINTLEQERDSLNNTPTEQ